MPEGVRTIMTAQLLETPEADLVYDIHGPLPTADGRPPLVMIGQPMDARGFTTLASYFPDRTVITYDPRGLRRSTRKDGRVDHAPVVQAADVHAIVEALGAGPVEMFASSGYRPEIESLTAAGTRVVIAVGEESLGTFTGRTSEAAARLLGQQPAIFPSHHGGFAGGEFGYPGQPEAFARKLREVLDA
jgi:hypothetical protein